MKKFRYSYTDGSVAGVPPDTVTAHVIARNRKHADELVGKDWIESHDPSVVEDKEFDINKGIVYSTRHRQPK
jgi:hypothetical protein